MEGMRDDAVLVVGEGRIKAYPVFI